jgi:hypothetical protein|tara:strand:+ start:1061 stop:1168 length:108 start_codon:yes stop_codon:yes gene_type:complete
MIRENHNYNSILLVGQKPRRSMEAEQSDTGWQDIF